MSTADRWLDGLGRRAKTARYAIAAGVAALGIAAVAQIVRHYAGTGQIAPYVLVVCVVGLAASLPVVLPNATVAAVVVTAAGMVAAAGLGTPTIGAAIAQVIVAYRYGRSGRLPGPVLLGLPDLGLALANSSTYAVLLAGLVPVAAGIGVTYRIRSEAEEHRAVRHAIAGTLLENTARGERARIARELHDVVAHHISMISIQAESARLTTPGMPPAGAARLTAIGDTARAALTEMRRLLGVLREDAGSTTPDRAPQPGLRQLNELLDEARKATGAGTRLILHGPPVALDPGVELAAYRIVQEALTNTRRHAPGAAVDVELHFADGELHLTVRDNGPGPSDGTRTLGHGLLGMRERAAAVGGALRTGPAAAGGFLVEATLPVRSGDDLPSRPVRSADDRPSGPARTDDDTSTRSVGAR
ncbi:MAG TPA: sensor histidine kinase [Micromonosporaceae bacterium]